MNSPTHAPFLPLRSTAGPRPCAFGQTIGADGLLRRRGRDVVRGDDGAVLFLREPSNILDVFTFSRLLKQILVWFKVFLQQSDHISLE